MVKRMGKEKREEGRKGRKGKVRDKEGECMEKGKQVEHQGRKDLF